MSVCFTLLHRSETYKMEHIEELPQKADGYK